jgi:hypothetical protein
VADFTHGTAEAGGGGAEDFEHQSGWLASKAFSIRAVDRGVRGVRSPPGGGPGAEPPAGASSG